MNNQTNYRHDRPENPMTDSDNRPLFKSLRFRYGLGLFSILAIAGYFFWEDLSAAFAGNGLILVLLGACVGMHLFMHGGHGHGSHQHGRAERGDRSRTSDEGGGRIGK